MQIFRKKIYLFFFVLGLIPAMTFGQSCDHLFPGSNSAEESNLQQTRKLLNQISTASLFPDASLAESQSIHFAFKLIRRRTLLSSEKNGVLSGDGLYFFSHAQSLDLSQPESRLLDVRTDAWASVDHDYSNINSSAFVENGGLIWSRNTAKSYEEAVLFKSLNPFEVKWYATNGTLKNSQRFSFPVQAVLQMKSGSSWVIIPEKNFDYLTSLLKLQKKEFKLAQYLNQPILIYKKHPSQGDLRFPLEDSERFTSGDDLISSMAIWDTGHNMIARAISSQAISHSKISSENDSPSNSLLYENELILWNSNNGKKTIHISKNAFLKARIQDPFLSISLSPDERFVACIFKNIIRFFDLTTQSWHTEIPWPGVSSFGKWSPDGKIFLAQDTHHFLKIAAPAADSVATSNSPNTSFVLQALKKQIYFHHGFSHEQPIQWLNHRVFVSNPVGNQKTIAVDIQTGDSLTHIFKNLPGLIFNNSNIAYRVIQPEGSRSYQLEVYQKVSLQPK